MIVHCRKPTIHELDDLIKVTQELVIDYMAPDLRDALEQEGMSVHQVFDMIDEMSMVCASSSSSPSPMRGGGGWSFLKCTGWRLLKASALSMSIMVVLYLFIHFGYGPSMQYIDTKFKCDIDTNAVSGFLLNLMSETVTCHELQAQASATKTEWVQNAINTMMGSTFALSIKSNIQHFFNKSIWQQILTALCLDEPLPTTELSTKEHQIAEVLVNEFRKSMRTPTKRRPSTRRSSPLSRHTIPESQVRPHTISKEALALAQLLKARKPSSYKSPYSRKTSAMRKIPSARRTSSMRRNPFKPIAPLLSPAMIHSTPIATKKSPTPVRRSPSPSPSRKRRSEKGSPDSPSFSYKRPKVGGRRKPSMKKQR